MNKNLINLRQWFNMSIDEKMEFLKNGGELTDFSRRILITCDELKRHGAIISEETILKYYKEQRRYAIHGK